MRNLTDYRRAIPKSWFETILGMQEDTDEGRERRDAFEHFLGHFLPERASAWISKKTPAGNDLKTGRTFYQWNGLHYPKPALEGQARRPNDYGIKLTRQMVLSLIWKGELAARTSIETVEDLLGNDPDHREEALLKSISAGARDLLFPGSLAWNRDLPLVPASERWIGLCTGIGAIRSVVVDLDVHQPGQKARFKDSLQFFLTHPAIPRPHLIVATRRNGRHLIWFAHNWSPSWPSMKIISAKEAEHEGSLRTKYADIIRANLLTQGIEAISGFIEVYPKGSGQGSGMPTLPFGPGYRLCDASGELIAASGIESLVGWHRQCRDNPLKYLSAIGVARFASAPALPELTERMRVHGQEAKGGNEKAHRALNSPLKLSPEGIPIREARPSSGPASSTMSTEPHQQPTKSGQGELDTMSSHPKPARDDVRRVFELLRDGPEAGRTNDDLPLLVRFFKCNAKLNEPEGHSKVLAWLKPRITKQNRSHYVSRVKSFWNSSKSVVPAPRHMFRISDKDCAFIAAHAKLILAEGLSLRSIIKVWLVLIGTARNLHGEVDGWAHWVNVYFNFMKKAGGKNYWKVWRAIETADYLRVDQEYIHAEDKKKSKTRMYAVELPICGKVHSVRQPDELWPLFVQLLSEEDGVALAGKSRNWKNWKNASEGRV